MSFGQGHGGRTDSCWMCGLFIGIMPLISIYPPGEILVGKEFEEVGFH